MKCNGTFGAKSNIGGTMKYKCPFCGYEWRGQAYNFGPVLCIKCGKRIADKTSDVKVDME